MREQIEWFDNLLSELQMHEEQIKRQKEFLEELNKEMGEEE